MNGKKYRAIRRGIISINFLLFVCLANEAMPFETAKERTMSDTQTASGARDFDFLLGRWRVQNKFLKARLKGSNEWLTFEASLEVRSIIGGLGNVDQYKATLFGKPLEGTTLRVFNPQTKKWSLYWVDNWSATLQPPLVGEFKNGVGEFFTDDEYEGKKIKVRFIWSEIAGNHARWEQAFSEDGGKVWETNWIMEFSKI